MNDKICGYYLDKQQQDIVLDESKNLLVVAGAGSGKTLTIIGKIYYLIKYKNINPNEILCISFTKASSDNLKEKLKQELKLDMEVYTFHKLGLNILKEQNVKYEIADPNLLENVIHQFFYTTVLEEEKYMKLILKYFKVKYKDKNQYIKYIENNKQIEMLEKLISTFIHLFKCNGYNLSDFNKFRKKARINIFKYKQEKIFLILTLNIYLIYSNYLKENSEIDFDDMIIKTTNILEQKGTIKKYKYIIIDEYQDTSFVRFNLIKKLLNITKSSLMVVGDDFQSIYRFTGCDLELFLNFEKYFKETKTMKIENTYRNSQELIKIAGNFVMKNKNQITKNLKSNKTLQEPIKIIYYKNIKKEFIKLINNIYNETKNSILILGRNNKDIKMILDNNFKIENNKIIYLKNKDIEMNYLTVHKSKGLEEENVIIINLEDNLLGFPNKIKDSKLLRFVTQKYEKYPYSEERRLFYVALTRTKNYVYLLVPYKNESLFVKEIKKLISKY